MYRKALTRAWKRLGYSDELAELRTQIICTGEESELEWLAEQVRNRQFRRKEKACAYKLVGDVRMKQGQTREAFANYKKFKKCYIAITVSKYRDKIPEYIYEKLLTVRVEPY